MRPTQGKDAPRALLPRAAVAAAGVLVLTMAGLLVVLTAAALAAGQDPATASPQAAGPHDHHAVTPGTPDEGESFFAHLFKVYTPRQACMFYERPVIWLHVISDAAIAAAYYSIPLGLVSFVRQRRDVAFSWIFWMFAAFILACGTTHLVGLIDIWKPYYRLDGVVKLVTAILSIGTAVVLWPLIPKLVALPSPAMLEATVRQRTAELARSNEALREEMSRRAAVEAEREKLLAGEQAARQEAERVNRMKDEFLATLSHELRTPLTAMLGWAQILERSADARGEVVEGLKIIRRNARAQAQLVDDLLDMNRIAAGKMRLDARPVKLHEVIESAAATIGPAAAAKRVDVRVSLPPGPTRTVRGDPARLQQVVWNLLTNAVKFTPAGGHVSVELRDGAEAGTAEIVVRDTGIGIDPGFLPRMFERFTQADATITRKHGGLGLGLAITRHLVELHGGSVRAESDGPNRGASFVVTLPTTPESTPGDLSKLQPPTAATGIDFDPAALAGLGALVIDDDADARAFVRRVLEELKMRVSLAGSAEEAMRYLPDERPDVIVCDIGMPGEDGYAFLRRVRAMPPERGGATPAVALTAFAGRDDRDRSLAAGFQVHVPKPVDGPELAVALLTALRASHSGNPD